ncbi:MAG: tryptophan--tRNA ligase, partial [Hyphomonadaceae bacterium]
AILLSSTDQEIETAVQRIYTDPNHLRVSDPGRVDGNVVFTYLDAFDTDKEEVENLKAHYARGGLGYSFLTLRLSDILKATIGPIRERRALLSRDPDTIMDILRHGTKLAREITERTKVEIMTGLGLFRL